MLRKTNKLFAVLFNVIILLCLSCEKDEQGLWVTYYNTIGKVYVIERDSNMPLKGTEIFVTANTCVDCTGILRRPSTGESFTVDDNGYCQIRFPKRVGGYKVNEYIIYPYHPSLPGTWDWETSSTKISDKGYICMHPSDIKNKKTITLDTIKYYISR